MRPVITQYSIIIMGLHHYQKPQPFLKVNDKKNITKVVCITLLLGMVHL